jgi:hypothetical protein
LGANFSGTGGSGIELIGVGLGKSWTRSLMGLCV